jgi:cytochrome c peroxidase
VKRNTPTLYYSGLQAALFYDLRSGTLEDQIDDVMRNTTEFNLTSDEAARRLVNDSVIRKLCRLSFSSDTISSYHVRNAIASYVRTLNPFSSAFDQYMKGKDAAMSSEARNGFNLFAGKAKCATCHFIPLFNGSVPPFYSKHESEVIGVPSNPVWDKAKIDTDSGRYRLNKLDPFLYAFKTTGIRNVTETAPYMHNGVYNTLEEVVSFYQKGGGVGIGIGLGHQTLPFDTLILKQSEKNALIAFMESLTD